MSAAIPHESGTQKASRAPIGEWFWRFLAVVMILVIGWVAWIAFQISPPDMVLPAAYEAAAQGRASRNASGAIGGAPVGAAPSAQPVSPGDPKDPATVTAATTVAAAEPVAATPPAATEPPVNLEKLRRAESIETPIFEKPRRAARPTSDASQ